MNIQKEEWYVLGLRDCVTYTNRFSQYVTNTAVRHLSYSSMDVRDLIKRR